MQRLAETPATAAELARSAGADRRAVTMLLDALVGLGQLERRGGRYRLSKPLMQMLRCPGVDSQTYFDDFLTHTEHLLHDWSQLTSVVRSGEPVMDVDTPEKGETFFPSLARRLFSGNYLCAKKLLGKLPRSLQLRPLSVVDVAAGSAAWSIPFAEANRLTNVVAVDFAPVLEVARHFARSCNVEQQFTFAPGNIRGMRFGADRYDVAILGHICHSEGASRTRALFRKICRALTPRGIMIVAEWIADEKRLGKHGGAGALVFALNMLVHTEKGGTYTLSEYRSWAREAGFRSVRRIEVPATSPVMVFRK